jgi:hypothetical protein
MAHIRTFKGMANSVVLNIFSAIIDAQRKAANEHNNERAPIMINAIETILEIEALSFFA